MPDSMKKSAGKSLALNEDEIAVVALYRTLQLDRREALRRLATPSSSPMLPQTQELQSNFAAVAQDPLPPDPTSEYPTR